jgi:cytochrome c oxidase subunit 2
MKKTIIFMSSLASLALLSACNTTGSVSGTLPENTGMEASSMSSDAGSVMPTGDEISSDSSSSAATIMENSSASAKADTSDARIIDMTVTDWSFAPNAITVKKGQKVTIRLKGIEGEHSFAIPELNINVAIEEGQTKDIVIPTDNTGTFTFRCMIPCGPGHKDMTGQLIIN